ncbi:type IV secretion system protein VirB10 [Phenylobacterium sp. LjRoot225]|uniref:type IV secretion system protein VirB10 n=1 Tax=Phenylobacterium sp. LjRoot225 TaxID=3342285 RepID=UPI003ECE0D81
MTDLHESPPRITKPAGIDDEEEVRRDDPFGRRRAMDDSKVSPERLEPNEGVGGERGISPVAGRFSSPQAKMAGVAAMVGGAALLLVLSWDRGDAKPEEPKEPARQVVRYDEVATMPPPLPPAPTTGAAGAVDPLTGQPLAPGQVVPAPGGAAGSGAEGAAGRAQPRETLADMTRRSPMMAFNQSSGASLGGSGGYDVGVASAGSGQVAAGRPATELDNLRRGSAITKARATALGDRSYMILAGTQIPCVLQTAMDSSLPGYTTCIIPRDVYSDNGRVVLLEKGTKVLGEYRGGMQRGQRRLFVLWTRAVTPQGVAIDLASPGADAIGRAGFSGDLDNRFFERFGGALLLSLVDDGVYVAAGRGNELQNTARVPSDVAAVALQSSINLPPILRKNQGEDVGIMVAQDFDFSEVYGVQAR